MTPPKTLLYTDTPPAQGREQLGTLVFVHGWPDSASLWDGQVERLSREGYRCVCVTLPGFGTSALDRAIVTWVVYLMRLQWFLYTLNRNVCCFVSIFKSRGLSTKTPRPGSRQPLPP